MHEGNDKIMIYTCTYVSSLGDILLAADESALLVCGLKARNAQPSLSKQLMELEKKLGKQLLIRGKKKKLPLQKKGLSCGNGDWLGRHKIFQAITISGHAFTGISDRSFKEIRCQITGAYFLCG